MADAYQIVSKLDFSGGINSSSSPYTVAANQVLRLENMLLDQSGALYVRDGAVTIDNGQFGTDAILSLYDLVKTDGTLIHLAIRRDSVGQYLDQRGGVTPWPQLGTLSRPTTCPPCTHSWTG